MHLEALIMQTGRCTWRPRSRMFDDAFGVGDRVELSAASTDCDRAGLEIHLVTRIK